MKIEVLGDGCAVCRRLHDHVLKAVKQSGVRAEVIRTMDVEKIAEYGARSMPVLIIDGVTRVSGKVPKVAEIIKWLE
jgi:small redox-active disulfide protein 2